MPGADLLCGDEALVGVGGGHADVDHGGVGLGHADRAQQRGGVARLADHVDAGAGGGAARNVQGTEPGG